MPVVCHLDDGTQIRVVLDQRDRIAASDAGAPPPEPGTGGVAGLLGLEKFMRTAAGAHLVRIGRFETVGHFEAVCAEVEADDGDQAPDPTPRGPKVTKGG